MLNRLFGNNKSGSPFEISGLDQKQLYDKLLEYYNNNDLYNSIHNFAYQNNKWVEDIKGLRSPVNRSVEFYVSKVLPNPEINCESDAVKQSIEQVWVWSNFEAQKQVAIRYLALYGNLFYKVASDDSKVFFELLDPRNITDFKVDTRNYVTEIRLDIPVTDEAGRNLTHTEYWNKEYYAIWEHTQGEAAKLEQLPEPIDTAFLAELGIDFVPFVYVPFRNIGSKYGVSCVQHCISKIDEANRQSTRLNQMLFRNNKPLWIVSANDKDANGRPLPAPKIKTSGADEKDLTLSENGMIYLPGVSTLQSLVPNIQYEAALNILNAQLAELESDLPELKYYSLKDGSLSGKAISMLLAGALDRASEARSNLIAGVVRLNQMALSVGSFMGFFTGIGVYADGSFDHSITCDPMLETDPAETATLVKTYSDAGVPLKFALILAGVPQEQVDEIMKEKDTQDTKNAERQSQNLANSLMQFNQQ